MRSRSAGERSSAEMGSNVKPRGERPESDSAIHTLPARARGFCGPPRRHYILDFLDHPVAIGAVMVKALRRHEGVLQALMVHHEYAIGGQLLYLDRIGQGCQVGRRNLHRVAARSPV